MICPGRRGVILRLGAKSPLSPLVSSCFVLAAVLVSADVGSVGSVSLELDASGSSDASSEWLGGATGGSVALRRGSNGDLLDARDTGALVVVFGCTCSLFRLRSLFSGLRVVERVGGGLVSAGACEQKSFSMGTCQEWHARAQELFHFGAIIRSPRQKYAH